MFNGFYAIINSFFKNEHVCPPNVRTPEGTAMYTEVRTTTRGAATGPITADQAAYLASRTKTSNPEYTLLIRSIDTLIASMAVKGETMVNVTVPPHLHKYYPHFVGEYTARQFTVSYKHNKGATECMLRISWDTDRLAAAVRM